MIMCVLLCYPVSIRVYYQQGVLFLVLVCKDQEWKVLKIKLLVYHTARLKKN